MDVDWSLGPEQEHLQTSPWSSHSDTAKSQDAYMNMMKWIKKQGGNPYQWYVSDTDLI